MAISARPLLAALLLLLPALLLSAVSAADSKDNPADQLVALVNSNRTASKASSVADNQGLGCIALQYIKAYEGQCKQVSVKKPMESSFTDTFAPNCGVQATTLSKITGRLVACQSNYASPAEIFDILINDAKDLQVLHSKNHTEVGAAVSGTDGGGPYFWCVLFSDGKPSTSFKVDGEVPKTAHPGCFSGNNDDCMGAKNGAISTNVGTSRLVAALLFAIACAFAL
ncbi:uncharacterized protein LOC133896361 [Phragmites australis]|uniref:uncharacterized protein LOC133896361 n=1 Tax=Phragmites australis TaxID=29695 RepID=UPI002D76BE03|nr:uncharacterized protein LOC133896361 [Phragmites australis]